MGRKKPAHGGGGGTATEVQFAHNKNKENNHSHNHTDPGNTGLLKGKLQQIEQNRIKVLPNCPDFAFETFLFLVIICHLLVQCYNLNGWNVHMYNVPYIAFSAILFTKRVAWKFVYPSLVQSNSIKANLAFRVMIMLVPFLSLSKSLKTLFSMHDIFTFMLLVYPTLLYYALFGFSWKRPSWAIDIDERTPTASKSAAIVLKVRHDVKHIIYSTFEVGYYAGWLPVRFLLNRYAIYDEHWCQMLVFYVVLNTLTLLTANWLSTASTLQQLSNELGYWVLVSSPKGAPAPPPWSASRTWDKGQRVQCNKKVYVAQGEKTIAEPGDWLPLFYMRVCQNLRKTASSLVLFQGVIVAIQVISVAQEFRYDAIMEWTVLITCSYLNLLYLLAVRRGIVRITGSERCAS